MRERKIPCEVYSRVVGYYRPVRFWNSGKKQEFRERINFKKVVKSEFITRGIL